jgi:FAD/FMN-containing dehydrogenase/Fe-S oxidoreductase
VEDTQRRIAEDLSGSIKGEFLTDPLTISMYSTDASLYQVAPIGVAFPRDRDDVVALVKYSAETETALIARGAGTSVTGAALGSGIIVDFSRHMTSIRWLDDNLVHVEPGVVCDVLNRRLRERGRYFPPDPSNADVSTIGGMLAIDAAGSRAARVGSTRDHVHSIDLVLGDGTTFEAGIESLDFTDDPIDVVSQSGTDSGIRAAAGMSQTRRSVISRLAALLEENRDLIDKHQPPMIRNTCGYNLRGVLRRDRLNLNRLLVGSEGTLGLFSGATLHTSPLPAHRGVAMLLFAKLSDAVESVQLIALREPSACDLLDRRLLSLGREADPRFAELIPQAAEAALIVEHTGYSDLDVRERMQSTIRPVQTAGLQMAVAHEAYTPDEVEFLWSLPSRVVPLLARLQGNSRPLPFVEDIAVAPADLTEFFVRMQRVFQKHAVTTSLYAHAASGQIHLRPILPVPGPADGPRLEEIARDVYQVVFAVGGTISGEHGDGLSRTAFIRSQYGPLYRVFQQIKDIFDPHHLLNPGKIISDDPHLTLKNFRPVPDDDVQVTELQLKWKPGELAETIGRCNGCGVCRTQTPDSRMCPFFRLELSEAATPRAKANILRELMTGTRRSEDLSTAELSTITDLCFNCKQCEHDCPSNVNVPKLVTEARASYVVVHGVSRADWLLARAHAMGELGCTLSWPINWLLANRSMRWLMQKTFGIASKRRLPTFAKRSFLKTVSKDLFEPPPTGTDRKSAVVFTDHFANYHDPELSHALVAVLQHNRIPVHVPRGQKNSGMALVSNGDLDAARDLAEHNIRELAELAREGHSILCSEPSTVVCLKQEYPMMLDYPDIELVASQVMEAGEYLYSLHQQGQLRTDFKPLNLELAYHTPCHLMALKIGHPLRDLLSLIPQLRVNTIEKGCSGMAGTYGISQRNFETSLQIGRELISTFGSSGYAAGISECSSCRLQMAQETTRAVLHPIKLLALAYGLMPELEQRLAQSPLRLVVS